MNLRNTPFRYGAVTKTFHWVMALTVIAMIVIGFRMGGIDDLTLKIQVYGWHKSTGVCVLALAVLRLLWHAISRKPGFVASLKRWERKGAQAVHSFLYLAMICMPLSGWAMSSAAGRPVSFFGLFTLPDLVEKGNSFGGLFRALHFYLAWCLVAAITLHVLGALKHHFIDRDITLKRMLPFAKPATPDA